MFLLISSDHIGAPKRYADMASPYKALQRCVKRFGTLNRMKISGYKAPSQPGKAGQPG